MQLQKHNLSRQDRQWQTVTAASFTVPTLHLRLHSLRPQQCALNHFQLNVYVNTGICLFLPSAFKTLVHISLRKFSRSVFEVYVQNVQPLNLTNLLVTYGWASFSGHGSADRLKSHHGGEIKKCGLFPAGIKWRQLIHVSEYCCDRKNLEQDLGDLLCFNILYQAFSYCMYIR